MWSETTEPAKVLNDALAQFVGERCWSVTAGRGTGSVFSFKAGAKVPRDRPLSNSTLTEEERTHESSLGLLVWCAWRLDSPRAVVCGAGDSNEPGGPMVTGLRRLVGLQIVGARAHGPALDLELTL